MTIKLRKPTEAFAAIAWVVCSADKLGSRQELEFLYEQAQTLAIFEDCSLVEFQNLLGATFNQLFQTLPNGELVIPEQDVESVIQAVNKALTPQLRMDAFKMAVGLAYADNLCDVEKSMLDQLQVGLEIDDTVAQDILMMSA